MHSFPLFFNYYFILKIHCFFTLSLSSFVCLFFSDLCVYRKIYESNGCCGGGKYHIRTRKVENR